jgi:hypothetical protein
MRANLTPDYQIDATETRDRVLRFLNEIGISAVYEAGATGFSKGCRIMQGALHVDPACRISTILHEAGHLAITPRCFRALMDGDLGAGQREMLRIVDEAGIYPDDPFYRAVIQCSDPEATAWAWAAGTALCLPGDEMIRDDEYGDDGEAIRLALQMRAYLGVHGLAHAGFCAIHERNGVAAWPQLHFWTQEIGFPESAVPERESAES